MKSSHNAFDLQFYILFLTFIFLSVSFIFSEDTKKISEDLKSKIIFLMEKEAEQEWSDVTNTGDKCDYGFDYFIPYITLSEEPIYELWGIKFYHGWTGNIDPADSFYVAIDLDNRIYKIEGFKENEFSLLLKKHFFCKDKIDINQAMEIIRFYCYLHEINFIVNDFDLEDYINKIKLSKLSYKVKKNAIKKVKKPIIKVKEDNTIIVEGCFYDALVLRTTILKFTISKIIGLKIETKEVLIDTFRIAL